jgi:glycosyltransferase involved in cell wall biosynthesis
VLVVTYDRVGPRMAGPAIRAYELCRVLAREHDVVLACRHPPERPGEGFALRHMGEGNEAMAELIDWCDVAVVFGFVLAEFPAIVEKGKVVVADVYDPFTLEVLVQRAGDGPEVARREHWGALRAMNLQLRHGDFFLVASERQRDLVIGMLAALNRVNPDTYGADPSLKQLVAVVPFGLPPEPPVAPKPVLRGVHPAFGADDLILLWAGGIYEWFDPLTLIEGVARLGAPDVKLFFMGTRHPNPEVPEMAMGSRAVACAERLGVLDRTVFFNDGWVPYDERVGYLLEADVGVSTHFRHVETAYAFRTRMLDYIWAGLPVLCTEGDALADLVASRDLGEVVPPEDPDAVAAAIERLCDRERRESCAARLASLADAFRWDRVAEPLVRFCRSPRHAPDLAGGAPPRTPDEQHLADVYEARLAERDRDLAAVHAELFRMRQEREAMLREIDALAAFMERTTSSLPYRALQAVRRALPGSGGGDAGR